VLFALASLTVSASKVTLTVLHGQAMYNLEAWNRFLAAFEAAHPDIEIDLIAPPCGEAQDKIVTMTATGVPLDVVFNNCVSDYPTLAFQSAFVDLTSLVTRDEAELNTRDLVPGTLDAVRQLGRIYGIMFTLSPPFGVAYNARHIDEAGLARPPVAFDDPGWTWEKAMDCARHLTRVSADGTVERYGFEPSWNIFVHAVAQGSDFFPAEDYQNGIVSKATIATADNLRIANTLWEMHFERKVSPILNTMPDGTATWTAFGQGRMGMFLVSLGGYNWPTAQSSVAPWSPGQPFGMAGYPAPTGVKLTRVPGWRNVVGISRNTRDVETAWKFIKWLLTGAYEHPELLVATGTNGVRLSHWRTLAARIHAANPNEWAMSANELAVYVQTALGVWLPMPFQTTILGSSEINDIVNQQLMRARRNEISVEEALREAQRLADVRIAGIRASLGIE
jgi:ABC-type glycerol-3-phosphate transport system substrate-binding protein